MFKIENKDIISNFNNGKFLKKDLRKVFKDMCSYYNCNTRGYKEIDLLAKKTNDGIVFCHIGQWSEEKEANTFDFDLMCFDFDGNLTYDGANGELPKYECYKVFNDCNNIKHY